MILTIIISTEFDIACHVDQRVRVRCCCHLWCAFLFLSYIIGNYHPNFFEGDHWLGSMNPERDPTSREWTSLSSLSFFFVPIICGPACFITFGMMLWGLLKSDGQSIEAAPHTKSK